MIIKQIMEHLERGLRSLGPPAVPLKVGAINANLQREGYKERVIDLRRPRKVHALGDIVSLCDYLHRHGDPEKTTVFCQPERFIAVLDDRIGEDGNGDKDWITFRPEQSTPLADWDRAFRRGTMPHMDFRNFVEDRKDHVVGRSFVAAVKEFTVNQAVTYDADLSRGEAITLRTTRERGKKTEQGVVELDREFQIEIPLVVGWEKQYRIRVRVEADLQGQQVHFSFSPKDLTEAMHELANDLIVHLRESLGEGWLIVRGAPHLERHSTDFSAKTMI